MLYLIVMLSMITLGKHIIVIMLSVMFLIVMLNTIMLSVANKPLYAESNSAEYHYSECRYAKYRGAIK